MIEGWQSSLHVGIVSDASLEHASGVTRSVHEVTSHLVANGHTVTIVCPEPAPPEFGGAEVISTDSTRLMGFDIGTYSESKFRKLFNRLDLDILHAASPMDSPAGVLFLGGNGIRAANRLDIPIAAIYQTDAVQFSTHLGLGITKPVVKRLLRDMHNMADTTLVPSNNAKADVLKLGVRPESIAIWGRGVDTEMFNTERRVSPATLALRETIAPNGEIVLGTVSRLEPEKRLHKLAVVADLPNTRLLIVGAGTRRKSLQKLLGNQATFTGRLNGTDLAHAYAALDVFLFPSVSDTFGQVIQEAKASGVPVVAANSGGPSDLIEHGVTGYLYRPKSAKKPDPLLRTYAKLLGDDKPRRTRMGNAARASVEDRTWQVVVRQELVEYYRHAIEQRRLRVQTAAGHIVLGND